MKRIAFLIMLILGAFGLNAQTCPPAPGSTTPYVLIDSSYQVGTVAAGKTYVTLCYNNPTTTKVTGLQFRIWYDSAAFGGGAPVVTSMDTTWAQSLAYTTNTVEGNITITLVYTGSSSTFSIPNGKQFKIMLNHSTNFQNYTSIGTMKATGTSSYTARSSNVNGYDDALTVYNYGGVMKNVKLKFHGEFANVTGSKSKNLTVALEKKPLTGSTWSQVNSYLTDSLGKFSFNEDVDTTYYEARLFVKGDTMLVGNVVSTADANKINDWVLGTSTPAGFDYYTADVNGSNDVSVADVYGVFGRIAGRFSAWPNTVQDILFFSQSQYNTINGSSTNYRSTIPGVTNLYYTISGGVIDSVKFYVAVPGDANGTGYHMARLTPIQIINPAHANQYVIDEIVKYDNPSLATIEVNLPKLSVNEGSLVNIPVKVLTNGNDVSALQLALEYNSDMLEFRGVTATDKAQKWITFLNVKDGTVEWGGYDPSAGDNLLHDEDEAVTIQFAALKPQDQWAKSPLYTTRKFAGDANSADMNITPANGVVQILKVIGGNGHFNGDGIDVYPNPTESEIMVAFRVVKDSKVVVSIYDIKGSKTMEVVNQNMPQGKYYYSADLGNLAPGVYTAILTMDGGEVTGKRIVKN